MRPEKVEYFGYDVEHAVGSEPRIRGAGQGLATEGGSISLPSTPDRCSHPPRGPSPASTPRLKRAVGPREKPGKVHILLARLRFCVPAALPNPPRLLPQPAPCLCPPQAYPQVHVAQSHLCRPVSPGGTLSYPLRTCSLGVLPQSAGATGGLFPTCFWKITERPSHTMKPGGHLVTVAPAQSPQSPKSWGTEALKLVDTGTVFLRHWSATSHFGRDPKSQNLSKQQEKVTAPQHFRALQLTTTADLIASDSQKTSIPHQTAGGGPASGPRTAAGLGGRRRALCCWPISSSRKPGRAKFRKWKRDWCCLGVGSPQGMARSAYSFYRTPAEPSRQLAFKGPGASTVRRCKLRQKEVAKLVWPGAILSLPPRHAGHSPPRGMFTPLPEMWAGPAAASVSPYCCPHTAGILKCPPHPTRPAGPPVASRIKLILRTASGGGSYVICPHRPPPLCHPTPASCPRAFAHLVFCAEC